MATVAEKKSRRPRPSVAPAPPYRFTVEQYERMTEVGILTGKDHVELIEGLIVENVDIMTTNPPHSVGIGCTRDAVAAVLPPEWIPWEQRAIRLFTSEPEPDVGVVRGPIRRYVKSHPTPADIGMLIEVADSSLAYDREVKGPLYARARIPHYWIVNIPERKLEVYGDPKGGKAARYQRHRDLGPVELVPLILEGREIGQIRVRDLLP
jgi:Uma2 family endonuclease